MLKDQREHDIISDLQRQVASLQRELDEQRHRQQMALQLKTMEEQRQLVEEQMKHIKDVQGANAAQRRKKASATPQSEQTQIEIPTKVKQFPAEIRETLCTPQGVSAAEIERLNEDRWRLIKVVNQQLGIIE